MADDPARRAPTFHGVLSAIHVASAASAPMTELTEAEFCVGSGLVGDRYSTRSGTYSDRHHIDRQVTLIEREVLEALERDHSIDLAPHEHRRNLTTEGVPLAHLVGRYFAVGDAVLYGGRLNVPCAYLQDLLGKPVFRPLVHRSGLNARVVVGAVVRAGDRILPIDREELPPDVVASNEALSPEGRVS